MVARVRNSSVGSTAVPSVLQLTRLQYYQLVALCRFAMLDNPSRNRLLHCPRELLCRSTIKLLTTSNQTIGR